ncbi:hypothetical protein R3P38DRAFT_1036581 [Favolaschia claudopus]|uniref:Secreted protein n=1 Tax=Favolaschia claudopus TaxID=2862362 RepID=A0AAW0BIS1_9AGAR
MASIGLYHLLLLSLVLVLLDFAAASMTDVKTIICLPSTDPLTMRQSERRPGRTHTPAPSSVFEQCGCLIFAPSETKISLLKVSSLQFVLDSSLLFHGFQSVKTGSAELLWARS